ncbi:protein kinase domain-containing protein [Prosthecobacter sp.]|uniref:protein kinase domain-containing protein n=1 Tax=Prosthecobacter sp. TaxID=1965333 RepID=UPI003784C0C4
MTPEPEPPSSDPLFGNAAADLLQGALEQDATKPVSDPRLWQPPELEELQARLEGYVVESFLARGGMGAVYRGMQTSLERPVAIKILPWMLSVYDASFAERFKQEARAMAQLNHPGIVKVFDFGEMRDGTLYFIMEFVDGTDVGQMVARQGRLSSAHALEVTAHVCDALQYAHERGVVHRDIKPANIMIGVDGQVKVADFGLAKSSQSHHDSLTVTGHVMGTMHFLAPEALTLGSRVDHRADIYATGVMLYQMLTGRLPQGIFELPSLLVKGLDPRFDPIIASAMREDREVRYQSIREMRLALDGILTRPISISVQEEQESQAAPVPPAGQAPLLPEAVRAPVSAPDKKFPAAPWWLAGAAILALGGLSWLKFRPSPGLPDSATQHALVTATPRSKTPQAVSNGIGQFIELPLISSGGSRRLPGYRPQLTQTFPSPQVSLRNSPAGLEQAEYGFVRLGPADRQRSHAFIIDKPDSLNPRLYVDSNANGDLGDDPPASWARRILKKDDGTEEISAFGSFQAELNFGGERPANVRIEAYRFGTGMPKRPQKALLYYSDYLRAGSILLEGKVVSALLCDDDCKGDFSAPTSSLRIDLNGDGRPKFFHVKDAFKIGASNYEIADLTPSGASFRIVPSSRSVPEFKPQIVLATGMQAPPFEAATLDGSKIAVPAAFKGKILLLDFWSTWCPPCVKEAPYVVSAYQKHHAAGLEILGISLDQNRDQFTAFLKEKSIVWPQVFEGKSWDASIARLYHVNSIPAAFLIDGDTGRILATGVRGAGLDPAIAKALAEKKR